MSVPVFLTSCLSVPSRWLFWAVFPATVPLEWVLHFVILVWRIQWAVCTYPIQVSTQFHFISCFCLQTSTSQSLTGFTFIKASPWLKFPPLCAHSHLTRWMRECNTARISAVGPSSATPEPPWLNLCVTSALQWRGTLFPWILFYKEAISSLGRHYIDLLPNMPWIPILPLFTAEVIIADGVQSTVFLSCTFSEVTALLLEATVHPVDFTAIDEVWN